MELLKNYWPILLFAAWMGFRWWRQRKVLALLPGLKAQGAIRVDVRSTSEFQSGHAPDSINIPLDQIQARAGELPKDKPILVACASGMRSASARGILIGMGFRDVHNVGNWTRLA